MGVKSGIVSPDLVAEAAIWRPLHVPPHPLYRLHVVLVRLVHELPQAGDGVGDVEARLRGEVVQRAHVRHENFLARGAQQARRVGLLDRLRRIGGRRVLAQSVESVPQVFPGRETATP